MDGGRWQSRGSFSFRQPGGMPSVDPYRLFEEFFGQAMGANVPFTPQPWPDSSRDFRFDFGHASGQHFSPAVEQPDVIPVGTVVRLRGLQQAAHHNGEQGSVEAWDRHRQRYVVRLDTGSHRA